MKSHQKEEAQNNEVTNEEPSKEEATSNEVTSEEQPKKKKQQVTK